MELSTYFRINAAESGQFERNRIEWQAIVETAGGDSGRALADGVQGCQAASAPGPAEQAGQHRGDGAEQPQGAPERGHEMLVVRDVHRHRRQSDCCPRSGFFL